MRQIDMWQADHTELDLLVLDERGKPTRPWLTVVLNDHSRAVAGYAVFFGPPGGGADGAGVPAGAVWRKPDPEWAVCGLPSALYSDHRRLSR